MPNLRRGRILQFVMPGSYKSPGRVYPAIVLQAFNATCANLLIFTEDGVAHAPSVTVSDEPTRGSAFWPDLGADAIDVDFVALPPKVEVAPVEPVDDGGLRQVDAPAVAQTADPTSVTTSTPSSNDLSSVQPPVDSPTSSPTESEPVTATVDETSTSTPTPTP